jgi:hypothetical protein
VAGIIDHRNVRLARLAAKIAQRLAHVGDVQVELDIDRIEPGLPEHAADQRGIVRRVRRPRHVLVGRVAHHERHALLGQRSAGPKPSRKPGRKNQ